MFGFRRKGARDAVAEIDLSELLKQARELERKAPHEAAALYAQAVDVGSAEAMYRLGRLQLTLGGGPASTTAWLVRAAESGSRVAMHDLGVEHERHHEPEKAREWFERARDAGHPLAGAALDRIAPELTQWHETVAPAQARLRTAATSGDPAAMVAWANELWARHTSPEALSWYRRAAEAGDLDGMRELAWHLRQQRDDEARQWIVRRADADPGSAGPFDAAVFYLDQDDPATAEHWFRVAANRGDARATVRLAELAGPERRDEAMAWWRLGADAGNPAAMAALGAALADSGDTDQARQWLTRSAAQGHGEYALATLLHDEGEQDAAEKIYRDLVESADHRQAMIALGLILETRGELDDARILFEEATVQRDDRADCLARRVQARQHGRADEVARWSRRADDADPQR